MSEDIFQSIFDQAADLLIPVSQAAATGDLAPLLDDLGLITNNVPGVDLKPITDLLTAITHALAALRNLDGPPDIAAAAAALDDVAKVLGDVKGLPGALHGLPGQAEQVLQQLVPNLIGRWLHEQHPAVYRTLYALGVITAPVPDLPPAINDDGSIAWWPTPVTTVDLHVLLGLLHNPEKVLREQIIAAKATGEQAIRQVAANLWPRLQTAAQLAGIPVVLGGNPGIVAARGDLGAAGNLLADTTLLVYIPGHASPLLTITLVPPLTAGAPISAVLTVADTVQVDAQAGPFRFTLTGDGTIQALAVDTKGTVTLPTAAATGDRLSLTARIEKAPPTHPDPDAASTGVWRIGPAGGTHLTVNNAALSGAADFAAAARAAIRAELDVDLTVVLNLTDGDNFIAQAARMLLRGPLQVDVAATLGWAWGRSIYLRGGASVKGADPDTGSPTTRLPVSLTLGPVSVDAVTVALIPQRHDDGSQSLAIQAGIDVGLDFGPFTAAISNVGLQVDLRTADGGNLGPLDARLQFKPPDGAGLSIAAGPVTGGGYLSIDAARGRYVGALALQVGTISIQGVGVLDTKIPDIGWALVALADVTGLSVQLGFGIELTGVGLLVAVHRTMNVAALQSLARGGNLETVMFPVDLAQNAARVAADLDSCFPPAHDEYVVGPIVQLAWGTNGLLSADLAIFIEFPHNVRIAVLGVVNIVLPEDDAAVVVLHLDVLGVIDLTAKTVSLDLSLSHSSIAGMPLSGQAAMRGGWGANPEFLFSAGGFHPHFVAPAGFPTLERIALTYTYSNEIVIRFSTYLAITPNTVQFGAAADLCITAGPIGLRASMSFDALIQFKPFHLELDLTIRASLTLSGNALLALDISLHLDGPGPWRLSGQVRFTILFCTFTVPISGTFGQIENQPAAALVDPLPALADAVADPANWTVPAPTGTVIALRKDSPAAAVHPLGGLAVHQRILPLNLIIDRLGADKLKAPTTFTVEVATSDGTLLAVSQPQVQTSQFAPGQYLTMTDTEKLTAPAFEPHTSGVAVLTAGIRVPNPSGTIAAPDQPAAFTPCAATVSTVPILDDAADGSPAPQVRLTPNAASSAAPVVLPAALFETQLQTSAARRAATPTYQGPHRGYHATLPTYNVIAADNTFTFCRTFAEALAASRTTAAAPAGLVTPHLLTAASTAHAAAAVRIEFLSETGVTGAHVAREAETSR